MAKSWAGAHIASGPTEICDTCLPPQPTLAAVQGDTGTSLYIESAVNTDPHSTPVCRVQWDDLTLTPSVYAVMATAIDMYTCAAYADVLIGLMRSGIPPNDTARLATFMLSNYGKEHGRHYLGHKETFTMLPAGSTTDKTSAVVLRRGSKHSRLNTAQTREIASHWLQAATVSQQDSLVASSVMAIGDNLQEQAQLATAIMSKMRETRGPGYSS